MKLFAPWGHGIEWRGRIIFRRDGVVHSRCQASPNLRSFYFCHFRSATQRVCLYPSLSIPIHPYPSLFLQALLANGAEPEDRTEAPCRAPRAMLCSKLVAQEARTALICAAARGHVLVAWDLDSTQWSWETVTVGFMAHGTVIGCEAPGFPGRCAGVDTMRMEILCQSNLAMGNCHPLLISFYWKITEQNQSISTEII